jgi:hypothetical protein
MKKLKKTQKNVQIETENSELELKRLKSGIEVKSDDRSIVLSRFSSLYEASEKNESSHKLLDRLDKKSKEKENEHSSKKIQNLNSNELVKNENEFKKPIYNNHNFTDIDNMLNVKRLNKKILSNRGGIPHIKSNNTPAFSTVKLPFLDSKNNSQLSLIRIEDKKLVEIINIFDEYIDLFDKYYELFSGFKYHIYYLLI